MPIVRSVLIATAVLVLSTSAAFALTTEARREAPGTPDQVWALISDFCAIKDWHPAVKQCVEKKNGDTVTRELTLADGGKIVEQLTAVGVSGGDEDDDDDDGNNNGYSYKIVESPLPVQNYTATLWVSADDDDPSRTEIHWKAKFDAKGASDEKATQVVNGILSAGVAGIKKLALDAADKRQGVTFTPPKVHKPDSQ